MSAEWAPLARCPIPAADTLAAESVGEAFLGRRIAAGGEGIHCITQC